MCFFAERTSTFLGKMIIPNSKQLNIKFTGFNSISTSKSNYKIRHVWARYKEMTNIIIIHTTEAAVRREAYFNIKVGFSAKNFF